MYIYIYIRDHDDSSLPEWLSQSAVDSVAARRSRACDLRAKTGDV